MSELVQSTQRSLWDKLFLHPFSGLVAMATLPLKNRQRDFGSHSVSIRDELDLALNPQMVGQR